MTAIPSTPASASLLGLPLEIRLNIYSYLVLPPRSRFRLELFYPGTQHYDRVQDEYAATQEPETRDLWCCKPLVVPFTEAARDQHMSEERRWVYTDEHTNGLQNEPWYVASRGNTNGVLYNGCRQEDKPSKDLAILVKQNKPIRKANLLVVNRQIHDEFSPFRPMPRRIEYYTEYPQDLYDIGTMMYRQPRSFTGRIKHLEITSRVFAVEILRHVNGQQPTTAEGAATEYILARINISNLLSLTIDDRDYSALGACRSNIRTMDNARLILANEDSGAYLRTMKDLKRVRNQRAPQCTLCWLFRIMWGSRNSEAKFDFNDMGSTTYMYTMAPGRQDRMTVDRVYQYAG